jgi:WD40 repeat protein
MPELREVFEMTTRQVEPDVDAWREQEKRQRRSSRNKRIGAFAVAAVLGLAAIVLVLTNRTEPGSKGPAGDPSPVPRTEISGPSFLDLQTGETTPLPESLLGGSLYFVSPDQTMLVINSCCDPPNPVSIANVDGTDVRQVTPDGVDGFAARWSPDGSSLVYQGRNAATSEIGNLFVIDVATGVTTQITDLDPLNYGGWSMHPSFGPDGETVIFHMPRGPDDGVRTRSDIWSVPASGGEPSLLVRDAGFGAYGADGSLAYLDAPRGGSSSRLMLADADGSDPRLLVEGQGSEIVFRWSPDGTRIAYSDTDGTHIVDVSTGEASLVAADVGLLDWFGEDALLVAP